MKTFQEFIDLCCEQIPWPEAEVRRLLSLHLKQARISEQDVVIYINYPEYTELELAAKLGTYRQQIVRRLARVRKVWPSLLSDSDLDGRRHEHVSIPEQGSYQPWMDEQIRQKF